MISNPRQLAVERARARWEDQPVYLDTETTGISKTDAVIEIAVIDAQGSPILDTLVHTTRPISVRAREIHGITQQMIETAPRWEKVANQLQTVLEGQVVGLYNARFDLKMIAQTNRQHGIPWDPTTGIKSFDLMELYGQFRGEKRPGRPGYRWFSLEEAGRQCGISLPNTHRARGDALLTRALHRVLAEGGSGPVSP